MNGQGIRDELERNKKQKAKVIWVVRDSRGRRVLGTARNLRAAIKHAENRGECLPVLEQLRDSDKDSPSGTLWRRTL
jgi:hypothetical protein